MKRQGFVDPRLAGWLASLALTGWWSFGAGQDAEIAARAREDAAGQRAAEIGAAAAAKAISELEIKHVTIRQNLEREVQTHEIYRECRSGPDAVRLLNDTLGAAGAAHTAAGGELSASAGADR